MEAGKPSLTGSMIAIDCAEATFFSMTHPNLIWRAFCQTCVLLVRSAKILPGKHGARRGKTGLRADRGVRAGDPLLHTKEADRVQRSALVHLPVNSLKL